MNIQQPPSQALIEKWLTAMGLNHYICEQCTALHISVAQGVDVSLENRLFVEEWGLLLSVEFQVRPTAMMVLAGELGQLNATYPTLKLFLDIVDDAVPQLVAGATALTGAGISVDQFTLFVSTSLDAVAALAEELQQMDCLYQGDGPMPEGRQLH
ncbi:MAG: YbjN domain-containing protein [Porticoccaceae bacterium]